MTNIPYARRMPMQLAVGAVVLKNNAVLLVQRGRPPQAGSWSLPGGKVGKGEPLAEAIVREVLEETSLSVAAVRVVEVVVLSAEGVTYEIHEFLCSLVGSGEARAGDDARSVCWCREDDLTTLGVSSEVQRVIRLARA